jgi:hypothetical protein
MNVTLPLHSCHISAESTESRGAKVTETLAMQVPSLLAS